MLLHAEQALTHAQAAAAVEGTVISETSIDEIYDKGAAKGAIMYMTRKLFDAATGDLLVTMGNVAFLRGDGGFGGKSEGQPKPRAVPSGSRARPEGGAARRALNQALIYRLSGDYNPLHIDPEVARQRRVRPADPAGLCGYGMVGRALIKTLCGDDPARLRRLDVRFTSPVFPGEPLHVEIWKIGAGDASFRCRRERPRVVSASSGLRLASNTRSSMA